MTTTPTTSGLAQWQRWREEREAAVTAPHGVASLAATHWLTAEPQEYEGVPGRWEQRDGKATRVGSAEPLALAPGDEATDGDLLLRVIEVDGAIALRVLDPSTPSRTRLAGIDAFAPDDRWVADGRFVSADDAAPLAVTHYDGSTSHDVPAGQVTFEVDGQAVSLTVFPLGDGRLQATFADATNGRTTKQFRFLTLDAPAEDGTVRVDLNRSYLPPCAFSDHYRCPLPLPENRLTVAIAAGETFARTRG